MKRLGLTRNGRLWLLLIGIVVLAGCSRAPVDEHSTGIWSHYFVYPLSWLIRHVARYFSGEYGLAIILLTVVIRLLLIPVALYSKKKQQKMKELQPEIVKLRETYSSKDRETQRKLQQEMMHLYQQHKVNPISMGCLPLLIQMPILIAFYYAIIRTPEIGVHSFLWFQLGHPDSLHLLPIIAALTTFVQQKVMNASMNEMNPQLKMMGYIMPLIIVVSSWNLFAVLPMYWIVGNVIAIVQTVILNRMSS
ncbi:OxaA-like protein precursor [Fictibacillus macauensis ZFHKF-1]|uniref:Membrane protein insertase YidC n=1 Tax=Fictibacillus macauensis ZFHKF-1 TaxID=1196324 RepID=I8AL33_9BACL|nr:membrane protein insertase YidC [Fictibacillus macauensis]EIT86314.1 OxaA-like protein precursor [Fictibacillus macauensis ZFHKF-1]